MTDKEQVIQALRATLLSVKGALTLEQCNRDYKALQGSWIPYKKLGYQSLEQLFEDVPGFETRIINGIQHVDAIPTPESAHIVSLISRQKSSKRTKVIFQNRFPTKQVSWRRPTSTDSVTNSYNNQYSRQYYSPKNIPLYNNNHKNKVNSKPNKTSEHVSQQVPERCEKRSILKKSSNGSVLKKPSQPLTDITQSVTTAVNSNENETTTKTGSRKVSAAQRMLHLREKLNVLDTIPLPLPAVDNECTESNLLFTDSSTHADEVFDLEPPPESAPSVEKLEWTCKRLGLDKPVYKVCERRLKHEPLRYDCTVKVGNSYSASSYPSDSSSQDEAKEIAAFKLLSLVESSESGGLPTASDERAMSCLTILVSEYDAGLWASTIPHLYRQKFGENLPTNWQDLVEICPQLLKERLVNGLVILANTAEEESPITNTPFDEYYDSELPPLQFPEDDYWNVFVTVANSPLEVWVRIIGVNYSEASEKLNIAMNEYYSVSGNSVERNTIVENMWYAANVEDGGWQRAKVLEMQGVNVCVFLGDHGDEEIVHFSKLKILEQQFRNLPPQAILCRLEGVEELATSSVGAEVVRRLVGETLVAEPGPRDDPTEPTVSVVLYDTSTPRDLNLNKEIIQDFCISGAFNITQKLCEVEVGCVTEEGRVWVSRAGGAATVRAALAMLTSPGPYRRPLPTSAQAPSPNPNTLYIVKTIDGDWVRCIIISELDSEGTVRTQLVDSGLLLRAPLSSLVPLQSFSPALNAFPRQAVQVRLGPAERAASSMVGRLRELLLDNVVLCRAYPSTPTHPIGATPNVELFVRTGPQNMLACVNNSILIEYDYLRLSKPKEEESQTTDHVEAVNRKKERIFTRNVSSSGMTLPPSNPDPQRTTLPPAVLPAPGKCFDLYIAMAANPWNFVVQSNVTRPILQTMMASLQIECPKLTESDHPTKPASGELYTVFYDKDGSWYRVVVAGVVSADMVSVYFCDFGDLALFPANALRPIPSRTPLARTLPPQAIKARLYDIKPLHQDWTVEDCLRFQELFVEKEFVGVCKKVERDPLNPTEPLLTLELIDTSTDDDVYLNKLLVNEGRARLESAP